MRSKQISSAFILAIQMTGSSGCNESPPVVEDEGPPPPPSCGDGIQAPDELCDDGNLTPGDGCSAECVPSGTPLDCDTLYEGHWADEVNAVVGLSDGSMVVGGYAWVDEYQGWVSRYTPEGEVSWTRQIELGDYDFNDARFSDGPGLVDDGQLGVWVLAEQSDVDTLFHLDAEGGLTDSVEISVAFGELVSPSALARFDGDLWIGGMSKEDIWLGRYNPTTEEATTVLHEDYLGYRDRIRALAPDGDQLLVAATMSASPNWNGDFILVAQTDVLLITLDAQGNETNRVTVTNPDEEFAPRAEAIAVDSVGRVYIGGMHESINFTVASRTWAAALSPEGDNLWSWSSGGVFEGRSGFTFGGIAAVDDVMFTTFGAHDFEADENHGAGWTARIVDGELAWHHAVTRMGYQHYHNRQVLATGADQPRVVGKAWTQDERSLFEICAIAW